MASLGQRAVKGMRSWVSKLSVFHGTGDQEKEEVKDVGHIITKWLKVEERGLALIASSKYPVAMA